MSQQDTERRLACWLLLGRTPGLSLAQVPRLLQQYGSPQRLLEAIRDGQGMDAPAAVEYLRSVDWRDAAPDLHWLKAEPRRHLISMEDQRYPSLLRQLAQPPLLLWAEGAPECCLRPQLAVVGSRNASPHGCRIASRLAQELARAGWVVTSGLATGIDGWAHRGALSVAGETIAVTGCGPDRIYPASHRQLAAQIASRGTVLSEFPLGTPPRAAHFPRRNRLIAALSAGTLVVEAGWKSGALITARHALELGREVFAVPGSIDNALTRGCHALIRQGAKLVERVEDIVEELQHWPCPEVPVALSAAPATDAMPTLDAGLRKLLEWIDFAPNGTDALVRRSGLGIEKLAAMLSVLELKGYIASRLDGSVFRIR